MVKNLAEQNSSKSVESKNIKIVEPISSKNSEAKSSTKKDVKKIVEDPFADHDNQTRDFCNLCTTPPTKKPFFNQFNLPVDTTTNTASCMVQSCYISVKQIEAVVNAPKVSTNEEIESLKASIKSDSHQPKKRKQSKASQQTFQDRQMQMLHRSNLEAENQMKMEEMLGFMNKKIAAKALKKNLDRVGPHWYQELSNKQMALMEVLECSLLSDWEEGVVTRLHRILAEMGIFPRPNSKLVAKAVTKSYLSPILFLAYLYKFTTKHPLAELKYSVNDRLLLSGLAFLALPRTLMDLEWRIPIQYPKQQIVDKSFSTEISDEITHYAKKLRKQSSPYTEPLPYFVHRLRVEQEIIAKKERRHRMLSKKPPEVIQRVCRLPNLKPQSPLVSEPTEPMPTDNSQTSGPGAVEVAETETDSHQSSDSASTCLKTTTLMATKSSAPKSARFKIASNEKVNTRSSDPPVYRTEEDEEVEIRQLNHDSVSGMSTEPDRLNADGIETSPSSQEPPPEEKKDEGGLQINKKRSRQVKSESSEASVALETKASPVGSETQYKVEIQIKDEILHAAPETKEKCPSEETEQGCLESNSVFGTMERVYSIVMARIDETTQQTSGTKAPDLPTGDGMKTKPCVCAEELAAEKRAAKELVRATEKLDWTAVAVIDNEPSKTSEREASESVQSAPETVEDKQSLQSNDQPSASSLLPDPIPTAQAISAVLNGYWAGYCMGHDQDETEIEEKVVEKSKNINKCLQDALSVMGQEGNILAILPHSHKLPALTFWLKYRNGYKMTKEKKDSLLQHSRAQWDVKKMHPRNIRVPHIRFKTFNLDWSYKNAIVKKVEKINLKYFSDVRQALVDDTREYWPTMHMNDFYNPYYKNVFFAYLMSKEEDCVQTRLVF